MFKEIVNYVKEKKAGFIIFKYPNYEPFVVINTENNFYKITNKGFLRELEQYNTIEKIFNKFKNESMSYEFFGFKTINEEEFKQFIIDFSDYLTF